MLEKSSFDNIVKRIEFANTTNKVIRDPDVNHVGETFEVKWQAHNTGQVVSGNFTDTLVIKYMPSGCDNDYDGGKNHTTKCF